MPHQKHFKKKLRLPNVFYTILNPKEVKLKIINPAEAIYSATTLIILKRCQWNQPNAWLYIIKEIPEDSDVNTVVFVAFLTVAASK